MFEQTRFRFQTWVRQGLLIPLIGSRSSLSKASFWSTNARYQSFGTSSPARGVALAQETTITGPDFQIGQNAIDKTIGRAYSQRTFAFGLEKSDDKSLRHLIAILQDAFTACVQQVPMMGGTLVAERNPGGSNPYIKCGGGAKFIVKDLRKTRSFDALRLHGFRQEDFGTEEWFGIPNWETNPPAESVASLLQVNLVENGVLLTFCLSHNATDIVGWSAVVRHLAYECRQRQSNVVMSPPAEFTSASFDRAPYDHGAHPSGPSSLQSRHKGYVYCPEGYDGAIPPNSQWMRPNSARICTMSAEACKALKKHVAGSSARCSTHDAVVALIWRSISRAMFNLGRTKADEPAELALPVNTRAHNDPPLPHNYVGNSFYITRTTLPVHMLIEDGVNSLARAAGLIRRSIEGVTTDQVHDLHRLIDSIPSTAVNKIVQARFTPANYGGPGFFLASHFSLKLQEWDWGPIMGHFPVAYRMTTDTIIPGIPNIFPRTPDGGLEIVMAWDKEIWEQLSADSVWTSYVSQP